MRSYAPSREAPHNVNEDWSSRHRGHQGDRQYHSDPHSVQQQVLGQERRGANHPRSRSLHRLTSGATYYYHYRGSQGKQERLVATQNPRPQTYVFPSDATSRQRGQCVCYTPFHNKTREVLKLALALYLVSSSRSWSKSCGTPTAPRSLMCVSGLRIIAVSGVPGSTR